jgi:hypothetical protein
MPTKTTLCKNADRCLLMDEGMSSADAGALGDVTRGASPPTVATAAQASLGSARQWPLMKIALWPLPASQYPGGAPAPASTGGGGTPRAGEFVRSGGRPRPTLAHACLARNVTEPRWANAHARAAADRYFCSPASHM